MEATRELVATIARNGITGRRREHIFAVKPATISGKPQRALVQDPEAGRIAIVRGADHQRVIAILAIDRNLGWPAVERCAKQPPKGTRHRELRRGFAVEGDR